MKTNLSLLLVTLFTSVSLGFAQTDSEERKNGFGVGFKLNQVKQEFGLGMDLSSPLFLFNSVGVRLTGMYYFNEYYNTADSGMTSTPYFVGKLGMIGFGGKPVPFLRLYGEGGMLFGIPSSEISDESSFFGGYGVFGFEFFMSNRTEEFVSYYIELGGTGSGAQAEKLPNKPSYQDGFTIGTGFRFYF